jgi:hypothetical protein
MPSILGTYWNYMSTKGLRQSFHTSMNLQVMYCACLQNKHHVVDTKVCFQDSHYVDTLAPWLKCPMVS